LLTGETTLPDCWLTDNDLSLSESITSEWIGFVTTLKRAGITLRAKPDLLLWAGGDESGLITVKNLYLALQKQHSSVPVLPWIHKLWKLHLPLKLKLFSWLIDKDKLLTWEALQQRVWVGPSICPLCKHAPEDLSHLLMFFSFSKEVWHRITKHFALRLSWCGSSIKESFPFWFTLQSAPPSLVVHFS